MGYFLVNPDPKHVILCPACVIRFGTVAGAKYRDMFNLPAGTLLCAEVNYETRSFSVWATEMDTPLVKFGWEELGFTGCGD